MGSNNCSIESITDSEIQVKNLTYIQVPTAHETAGTKHTMLFTMIDGKVVMLPPTHYQPGAVTYPKL